jgi:arylsulfatase A-like enzyme
MSPAKFRFNLKYFVWTLFLCLISFSDTYSFQRKPNVVLILADDLGYGDVQYLTPDSKIPTPNINNLAKNGISFTNAHSPAAVCTPTRYSILTGKYPWRSKRKKGVSWVWEGPWIERDQFTLGKMFQQNGYRTACIGKWHLGMDWPTIDGKPATTSNEGRNVDYLRDIQNGPVDRGFDFYFGQPVPSFPPHGFVENRRLVEQPTDWLGNETNSSGLSYGIPGAMTPGWKYENLMTELTDKAIEWVRESSSNDEIPFFLYFPMSAPHTPIAPNENFIGKTDVGMYGDYVYEMDYHVGRLLKALKQYGLDNNTIIIFTSDNGPLNADGKTGKVGSLIKNYQHNSSALLRGMKSDAWEGGHRIPFIVSWPAGLGKGGSSDALISQVDLMATLASLTNVPLNPLYTGDSFDFSPVLHGKTGKVRNEIVGQSGNGVLSIQTFEWKLILSSGGGGSWNLAGALPKKILNNDGTSTWENVQLYKISNDMNECSDVAMENPQIVKHLMLRLKEIITKDFSIGQDEKLKDEAKLWKEVEWVDDINR